MTNGKYAIILGAHGGIGFPITQTLLSLDYTVLGTELTESALPQYGDQFTSYVLDLTNAAGVEQFVSKAVSRGAIDILVNAAGFIDENEPSLDVSSATIEKTLAVNLGSVARITEAFLPHLAPDARIIHISSTAALWGNPQFPIYSASKAGLNTFCRSIAKQFAATEKGVYCVCPGPTNTSLRERIAHDASKHQDPTKIAEVVRGIIDRTSPYKNGDVIIVRDGKESLHQSLD